MAQYLIKLPHTAAECLKALDEVAAKGSQLLPKIYWLREIIPAIEKYG